MHLNVIIIKSLSISKRAESFMVMIYDNGCGGDIKELNNSARPNVTTIFNIDMYLQRRKERSN